MVTLNLFKVALYGYIVYDDDDYNAAIMFPIIFLAVTIFVLHNSVKYHWLDRCECAVCGDDESRNIWPQATASFCRRYNFLVGCLCNCQSCLCYPSLCSSAFRVNQTGRLSASASIRAFAFFKMCYFVSICFAGTTCVCLILRVSVG